MDEYAEPMDIEKIDLLLQYTLLMAGESDEPFDRQLGPIHLIKYAYLADLAHAEAHQGEPFTGVSWKFHKFGPWSLEVFERIEPALNQIGAQKRTVSHPKYEDDFVRWSAADDHPMEELRAKLPPVVAGIIQRSVHSFGADTPSLLNHAYLTTPMLKAAPGELLDLSPETKEAEKCAPSEPTAKLTAREKRERKKRREEIRAIMRQKFEEKKKHPDLVAPDPPPRHDEVYAQGVAWLESQAGEPLETEDYEAEFSEDIWKSPARYDPDLS
jgi:hypothetical protein